MLIEYAKEKEEKEKIIFRKCHSDLLMTMSDCLRLYTKSIKDDLYC